MATLQELVSRREALERQIHEMTTRDRIEAIDKIRALMTDSGVTLADLGGRVGRESGGSEMALTACRRSSRSAFIDSPESKPFVRQMIADLVALK